MFSSGHTCSMYVFSLSAAKPFAIWSISFVYSSPWSVANYGSYLMMWSRKSSLTRRAGYVLMISTLKGVAGFLPLSATDLPSWSISIIEGPFTGSWPSSGSGRFYLPIVKRITALVGFSVSAAAVVGMASSLILSYKVSIFLIGISAGTFLHKIRTKA